MTLYKRKDREKACQNFGKPSLCYQLYLRSYLRLFSLISINLAMETIKSINDAIPKNDKPILRIFIFLLVSSASTPTRLIVFVSIYM